MINICLLGNKVPPSCLLFACIAFHFRLLYSRHQTQPTQSECICKRLSLQLSIYLHTASGINPGCESEIPSLRPLLLLWCGRPYIYGEKFTVIMRPLFGVGSHLDGGWHGMARHCLVLTKAHILLLLPANFSLSLLKAHFALVGRPASQPASGYDVVKSTLCLFLL